MVPFMQSPFIPRNLDNYRYTGNSRMKVQYNDMYFADNSSSKNSYFRAQPIDPSPPSPDDGEDSDKESVKRYYVSFHLTHFYTQ